MKRISHWIGGRVVPGTSGREGTVFNPALGEQMGQAGRLVVSERYLTPHSLKRWLMLMHAVLAGERSQIVIPPLEAPRAASRSLARGQ